MKIMTKEEEDAHYREVVKGGLLGGGLGIAVGIAGVMGASRRYPAFASLTLPFRSFLVTSAGTFGAIIIAERNSVKYGRAQDPRNFYKDEAQRALEAARAQETSSQRLLAWARENRYRIVVTSWLSSVAIALAIVGRNKYLSTSQKVVQARVYAQGLTLAVLIATAALEVGDAKTGEGRYETVMIIDPNDPEHKKMIEQRIHKEEYEGQDLWKDMVQAEERRIAAAKKAAEAEKKSAAAKLEKSAASQSEKESAASAQ